MADEITCANLSCLNASSELGISGTVEVQALVTNLSGVTTPLSSAFAQAPAVLSDHCTARLRAGHVSSLVNHSRDRIATHPEGFLLRRLYHPSPTSGLPRRGAG